MISLQEWAGIRRFPAQHASNPLFPDLRICSPQFHLGSRNYPNLYDFLPYDDMDLDSQVLVAVASDSAADRIGLIRAGFAAFVSVAEAFGPGSQEDMRTVAIAIYAGTCSTVFLLL